MTQTIELILNGIENIFLKYFNVSMLNLISSHSVYLNNHQQFIARKEVISFFVLWVFVFVAYVRVAVFFTIAYDKATAKINANNKNALSMHIMKTLLLVPVVPLLLIPLFSTLGGQDGSRM